MKLAFDFLGYGGLVPAIISIVLCWCLRRVLPESAASRYSAAAPFGIALFAGYVLLFGPDNLWPSRHWHWLPYLGALAALLGPIAFGKGLFAAERGLLYLLIAVVAAVLLVPTWTTLEPYRIAYMVACAGGMVLLMVLLDPLPTHVTRPVFALSLAVTALGVAVALTLEVSLKFGQLATIGTASLVGCFVGTLRDPDERIVRAVIPGFVAALGGCAFVGYLELQPHVTLLLLIPVAPLALWICCWGPLRRLEGKTAHLVQCGVVLLWLGAVMIWLFFG